jgi:roadblock/LC7 domain-containing protein
LDRPKGIIDAEGFTQQDGHTMAIKGQIPKQIQPINPSLSALQSILQKLQKSQNHETTKK